MIFLIIAGILFLILGGFYLANSWMRYHEWKGGTIIVVLSIAAIVYGILGLTVFHQSVARSGSQSSSSSSQVAQSGSQLNNGNQTSTNQQQSKEDYVLRQMQKTYAKFGDVEQNGKTFTITPTDNTAKQAMDDLAQNPDDASQDGWPNISKSVKQISQQLVKILGRGYTIRIVQPSNHHNVMLEVHDGHVLKNVANQSTNSNSNSNQ